MADDTNLIQFPVTVPGAKESAQQIGGLAVAFKQANESLNGTQKSAKDASNSLALVATNTKQVTQSVQQVATASKQADDSLKGMAITTARSAAAINIVGGELAQLNPALAGTIQAVGRASGAISGFTSVLGGPMGLAIGAAVAGIGLFIQYLRNTQTAEETLAASIAATTKAIEEQSKAATLAAAGADPSFFGRLAAAGGQTGLTPDQLKARQVELQAKMKPLQDRILELQRAEAAGARFNRPTTIEYRQKQEELARLQGESQRLSEYSTEAGTPAPTPPKTLPPPKKGPTINRPDGFAEYQREQEALQRGTTAYGGGLDARVQAAEDEHSIAAARDAEALKWQAKKDALDKEHDLRIQYARDHEKIDRAAQQRVQQNTQIAVQGFAAFASAGINAFMQLAEGEKVHGKMVLRAIGETLAAQGQGYVFQGLAETVLGKPSGPGLIGVGLAEIAFGAGLGAASRGGGAGGGGGGGGYSTRDSSPGDAVYWDPGSNRFVRGSPYAPVPGPGQPGTGAGSVIVNQTYQSTFAPTRQDSEAMARAAREGLRTGTINPNWAQGG